MVLGLLNKPGCAQNLDGYWLGVTYPSNPNQAVYNYALKITQANTTLTGTAQTSNPNVPFGGVAQLSGDVKGSTVSFTELPQAGNTTTQALCYWQGNLTYNPTDESLIGTYENILSNTCKLPSNGKVELYRIVLKSSDTVCRGSVVRMVVTGKNIHWYRSSAKGSSIITSGNVYTQTITQTTTFYITQTLYNNESPPVPITITVVDPTITVTPTNTGCDKSNGSLVVKSASLADWKYS